MPFVASELVLRQLGPEHFALVEPLIYRGTHEEFVIPAGFVTDLASVPRAVTWLIPRYGVYTRAAVLHDYLCIEAHAGRFVRADADGIFRRVLREDGVGRVRRWLMWTAVRAGSSMSGAKPRDWFAFLAIALPALAFVVPPMAVLYLWLSVFRFIEWLGGGSEAQVSTVPPAGARDA